MHSTECVGPVTRINVGEPIRSYDRDGKPSWHRTIVCHGGGMVRVLAVSADTEEALRLRLHPKSMEAELASLDVAQIDSLISAARAERQSRSPAVEPAGEKCFLCGHEWSGPYAAEERCPNCGGNLAAPLTQPLNGRRMVEAPAEPPIDGQGDPLAWQREYDRRLNEQRHPVEARDCDGGLAVDRFSAKPPF